MSKYISTFTAGFEEYIQLNLTMLLAGCEVKRVYSGLCEYEYSGSVKNIADLGIFSNTYVMFRRWQEEIPFSKMVAQTKGQLPDCFPPGTDKTALSTYRVRFTQANQFVGVDSNVMRNAEESINKATGLRLDRLGGDTEFWYIKRSEGTAYFGRLLSTDKVEAPYKGELKRDLARLICSWADIPKNSVVGDFFAGYGSIARYIAENIEYKHLFINDIDHLMVDCCRQRIGKRDNVTYSIEDCRSLAKLSDGSIDCIVTDPPWGLYKSESYTVDELYYEVFGEFCRIFRSGGELTILFSAKNEIKEIAEARGFRENKKVNILVNGKKAVLYKFVKL